MTDYRRLEGTTVDPEMTDGVGARIADPLWLLTRQWQVGEFHGEDASSPVWMTADVESVPLSTVVVGGDRDPLPAGPLTPVEPLVEAESVRDGPARMRERLEAGEALAARLDAATGGREAATALREEMGFRRQDLVADPLDPIGSARLALRARGAIDAARVLGAWSRVGGGAKLPPLASLPATERTVAGAAVDAWVEAERGIYAQPPDGADSWIDHRLEYRFSLLFDGEDGGPRARLDAEEYRGGRLDWFHMDLAAVKPGDREDQPEPHHVEVVASPLRYGGQPAARFWEFEDGDVDVGDLAGGPEDLARAVIGSYAAVAGDDWFLVPVQQGVGHLSRVRSVGVVDDFGQRVEIDATAALDALLVRQGAMTERSWRFFELTGDTSMNPAGRTTPGRSPWLYLPPVLSTSQQSRPVEAVELRRDEVANLVWAIERRVESAAGRPIDRDSDVAPPPQRPEDGMWQYLLATEVPHSWIPLVPVLMPGRRPETALRRGTVARPGEEDVVGPRAQLLNPGRPFIVHEEEVPRGGLRVTRRWQSARGHDGALYVWMGRKKGPSSGPMRRTPLRFDALRRDGGAGAGRHG